MKALFWLVGLFSAAVALALLMGQNGATVTLFWSPYRVDMSFNLVLMAVLVAFVVLYLAMRSVAVLQALPAQARQWRALQRERAVSAYLQEALVNQLAGRFVRARGAARHAVDLLAASGVDVHSDAGLRQPLVLAHLLAAEACQSLQDHDGRELHFALALQLSDHKDLVSVREGALMRALGWAMDNNNPMGAQRLLGQLPQGAARRTVALRLKLKLSRLLQDHSMGYETARLLAKHRAFSEAAAVSILRRMRMATFRECHDADQVRACWRSMDNAERRDPSLVLALLQRMHEVTADATEMGEGHVAWVQDCVEPLLNAYSELSDSLRAQLVAVVQHVVAEVDVPWLGRIEALQRAHPADPHLMLLAGETFFRQQLWGKAQQLFQQASRTLADPAQRSQAWYRLAQLAEERGDADAALHAWRQAALLARPDVGMSLG